MLPLDLHGLEVLVGHLDELALLVLERLHDLVVVDGLVLELADLLVADRPVVFLVHEVEAQLVLVHRAEHAHGHVDEPEGDGARPERARSAAGTRHRVFSRLREHVSNNSWA